MVSDSTATLHMVRRDQADSYRSEKSIKQLQLTRLPGSQFILLFSLYRGTSAHYRTYPKSVRFPLSSNFISSGPIQEPGLYSPLPPRSTPPRAISSLIFSELGIRTTRRWFLSAAVSVFMQTWIASLSFSMITDSGVLDHFGCDEVRVRLGSIFKSGAWSRGPFRSPLHCDSSRRSYPAQPPAYSLFRRRRTGSGRCARDVGVHAGAAEILSNLVHNQHIALRHQVWGISALARSKKLRLLTPQFRPGPAPRSQPSRRTRSRLPPRQTGYSRWQVSCAQKREYSPAMRP